jgi:hypothetical protein
VTLVRIQYPLPTTGDTMVVEAKTGEVLEGFNVELPGLDQFIEENGNKDDALKALWFLYRQNMEWKDYAVGAHKSIVKLTVMYQKIIPAIKEAVGRLAMAGFKDTEGKSLEFAKAFQDLVTMGNLIKGNDLEEKTTLRQIKKIEVTPAGNMNITYSCEHTEAVEAEKAKDLKLQLGQTLTCPTCHAMLETMQKLV